MKKALLTAFCATTLLMTSAIAGEADASKINKNVPTQPAQEKMMKGHHPHKGGKFHQKHKENAQAFQNRLKLTDEQKAQIEKNREKSMKKMQKIMEQEKKLKEQKREIMKENREAFEAILTDEQKAELQKMHEERKKAFEEMKKQKSGKKAKSTK